MSYIKYSVPSPWEPGYAVPGYIQRHSPVAYPAGVSRLAPGLEALGASTGELIAQFKHDFPGIMQAKVRDVPLPEGPMAVIGPFTFPAAGGKRRISKRWLYSDGGRPMMDWLKVNMGELLAKQGVWLCTSGAGGGCFPKWPLDSKSWEIKFPIGSSGTEWGLPAEIWRGNIPIVKMTKKQLPDGTVVNLPRPYGLYIKWETDWFTAEYREIRENVVTQILSAIVDIVIAIIDTIGQLFNFLGAVACAMMKPAMMALASYVGGSNPQPAPPPLQPPGMSAEEYAHIKQGWQQLQAANVKPTDLQKLYSTGGTAIAESIANSVSKQLCGGQDILPPMYQSNIPDWVWPLAVVGGAALAAKLLKGRR